MTQDEFDAKCWRKFRSAVLAQAQDRWARRDVRQMAEEMILVMSQAEDAVAKENQ